MRGTAVRRQQHLNMGVPLNSVSVALAGLLTVVSGASSVAAATQSGHHGMAGHSPVRSRPASLDTSLDRRSDHGIYRVRIESLRQPLPLNRIHSWVVRVDRDGQPVEGATIVADGGMPEHGHGFPTAPGTGVDATGGYVIDGVKFSMRGWWELKPDIRSPAGADRVTFNMVV